MTARAAQLDDLDRTRDAHVAALIETVDDHTVARLADLRART